MEKLKNKTCLEPYKLSFLGLWLPNFLIAVHFPFKFLVSINLLMNFDVIIGETNCYQTGKFQETRKLINNKQASNKSF